MTVTVNLNLDVLACSCGIVYAVPVSLAPHYRICPACAYRDLLSARSDRDENLDLVFERDRTIAALKGQITRLRGKR